MLLLVLVVEWVSEFNVGLTDDSFRLWLAHGIGVTWNILRHLW